MEKIIKNILDNNSNPDHIDALFDQVRENCILSNRTSTNSWWFYCKDNLYCIYNNKLSVYSNNTHYLLDYSNSCKSNYYSDTNAELFYLNLINIENDIANIEVVYMIGCECYSNTISCYINELANCITNGKFENKENLLYRIGNTIESLRTKLDIGHLYLEEVYNDYVTDYIEAFKTLKQRYTNSTSQYKDIQVSIEYFIKANYDITIISQTDIEKKILYSKLFSEYSRIRDNILNINNTIDDITIDYMQKNNI